MTAKSFNMNTKNIEDIFVFGYACKIFRDDEKALLIDQGKHLIPWMGDSTLKIDRYDVRATLSDVSQFEAPPGGYDNRLDYLSAAEQRAEQLCEEERYFSLYNNDFEEELYKEEKQKRLVSGYGQVGFNYDQSSTSQCTEDEDSTKTDNDSKDEKPDEVYVPHPRFYIPPNMELPTTTKVQAIIEKTARFISSQGPQMEILIKAKQANNPLFDFLNQSGRLNPFYKHTLQAMKDGNYPTDNNQDETTDTLTKSQPPESIYQSYYTSKTPAVAVPTIKYKPSADCAYTQLISKIKGVNEQTKSQTPSNSPKNKTTIAKIVPKTDVEVKQISNGLMLAQYYNSDSEDEEENPNNSDGKVTENSCRAQHSNGNSPKSVLPIPTLSDDISIPPEILCPPSEQRVIIDKTASYVLKNGKDFEDILRAKNDKRFTFLQYNDPYYKYYTFKLTGIVCPDPIVASKGLKVQSDKSKISVSYENKSNQSQETSKPIAPVSFSIKPKEEPIPTTFKPALPIEHSSDEEEQSNTNETESCLNTVSKVLTVQHNSSNVHTPIDPTKNIEDNSNIELYDSFLRDTILEQQNLIEKKLVKRAEEKVKDRLAQLAREKLGIISKEKQLQLERKRRAMAFVNQISGSAESKSAKSNQTQLPTTSNLYSSNLKSDNISDQSDSSDSVKFVMATSSTSICAAATQTIQKRRNTKTRRISIESDDVIEIDSKHSRSNSRSRSRSRSRSLSSRYYRHKTKRSKKKSSKRKSRSRSCSRSNSRHHKSSNRDYKRKRLSPPSKEKKRHGHSGD